MAGHSKWANIRFRKSAQDAKRGKIFTKLIREITVAAQTGGADETTNARLRDAVFKALKANMKRDTIDNAIKRGAGNHDAQNMMEMRYEGYGPGGVAILVDCLSDNKNRTVSEVRHAFTKYNGNLGSDGSVSYLFTKQGEIVLAPSQDEEKIMEAAINSGAHDIESNSDYIVVLTSVEDFHTVLHNLQEKGFNIEQAEIAMDPKITIAIDKETEESLIKLIDMLEDLDDVQKVYTNAQLS